MSSLGQSRTPGSSQVLLVTSSPFNCLADMMVDTLSVPSLCPQRQPNTPGPVLNGVDGRGTKGQKHRERTLGWLTPHNPPLRRQSIWAVWLSGMSRYWFMRLTTNITGLADPLAGRSGGKVEPSPALILEESRPPAEAFLCSAPSPGTVASQCPC